MQTEQSNGPRTELWGTLYPTDCTLAVNAFTDTVCFLSVRNDANRVSRETTHTLPIFKGDHSL